MGYSMHPNGGMRQLSRLRGTTNIPWIDRIGSLASFRGYYCIMVQAEGTGSKARNLVLCHRGT